MEEGEGWLRCRSASVGAALSAVDGILGAFLEGESGWGGGCGGTEEEGKEGTSIASVLNFFGCHFLHMAKIAVIFDPLFDAPDSASFTTIITASSILSVPSLFRV